MIGTGYKKIGYCEIGIDNVKVKRLARKRVT